MNSNAYQDFTEAQWVTVWNLYRAAIARAIASRPRRRGEPSLDTVLETAANLATRSGMFNAIWREVKPHHFNEFYGECIPDILEAFQYPPEDYQIVLDPNETPRPYW